MLNKTNTTKICLLLVMIILLFPQITSANVPYYTYTEDNYNHLITTQPAYLPTGVMANDLYISSPNSTDVQYSPLKAPEDIFIDTKDEIYISDTGNNRIVQLDKTGKFIREIILKESPLNQPHGLFVSKAGEIYIADTGNSRVVQLDNNGSLLHEYLRPTSKLLPASFKYEPIALVVDKRGFLYVATRGGYQGLLQLDPKGNLYGFLGTNKTNVGLLDRLRNLLYSQEQLRRQIQLLPNAIKNLDIDDTGYIYTTSIGTTKEQIKKLNIRGDNQWGNLIFGESIPKFANGDSESSPDLVDLSVDHNGNTTIIDRNFKVINQYDKNGKLIFFWTGPTASGTLQLGILQSPVAVATNSKNELFILDDQQNLIQVLKPTEFGTLVQKAISLTQDGQYETSEGYWKQLLKLNAHFSPAYEGLSKAAFHRGDYKRSMELSKLAGDSTQYSNAFWQIRLQWFQSNFSQLANGFILIGLLWYILAFLKRRKVLRFSSFKNKFSQIKIILELKHSLRILRHPIDGFSELRFEEKGSYLSSLIILGIALISLLFKVFYTSFTFTAAQIEEVKVSTILIPFIAIWFSWVICNYLISSIYRGEGRFKDVFMGSAYALLPIILIGLPLGIISNVLTLSEQAIYSFFEMLMIGWCGLLFFWKVQSLQNYSVGETILNMLFSLAAMLILWILAFILFGLSSEFLNFIYSIYQEGSM